MDPTLNDEAVDPLTKPMAEPEPLYWCIWFREKGRRWRKVGRASTYGEAVTLCSSSGDWRLEPVYPASDAGPGLFDDQVEE